MLPEASSLFGVFCQFPLLVDVPVSVLRCPVYFIATFTLDHSGCKAKCDWQYLSFFMLFLVGLGITEEMLW